LKALNFLIIMKRLCLTLILLCFISFVFAQEPEIAIIPQPVSIKKGSGRFVITEKTQIVAAGEGAAAAANVLREKFKRAAGFSLPNKPGEGFNVTNTDIVFGLFSPAKESLGNEGYEINADEKLLSVNANTPAGLFYAAQTILQLLPKEIESKTLVKNMTWAIPAVQVTDYPRFAWRGLMFDVVRHFFTKEQVKQFIDQMVRYKYNMLHLHLTDDQGWRIEIKSLPKLTEIGAWNVPRTGTFGTFSKPADDEPRTAGGFYTHDDIKELVKYAADRFVNILPEVDVPGHSMAAVASYPDLSCTPGKYVVNSGEKFMEWGVGSAGFSALIDNTLCPANEKVYTFLDKVFTEVAQLFPFPYIHMGGDECAKNFWEKDAQIAALMKKEKLKDMHEVQSYFVKRVAKIIESKGKKMIGWDEILEGGLANNAAVMSWRGIKGGIEAAKQGAEVVMAPNQNVYIDLMQGDPIIEPPVYNTVRLKASYDFEPVPDGVDPKLIKGGQANLWTEQITNMRHQQYMTWPRAFAVAESVWSPKSKKDWDDFIYRVEKHFERYDVAEIKYAPSMYEPIFTITKDESGQPKIEMKTEVNGLDIYYSFDNSFPDRYYPKYSQPLTVPKDAANLRVVTYRRDQQVGRMLTMPVAEIRKRADRKR
jgi:hexosaminidase